jgi:hypothetical protein
MKSVPIIRKDYRIKRFEVERGVQVILQFQRRPVGYHETRSGAAPRYGMEFRAVAENYEAAKAKAWGEYLSTLRAITCCACNKQFPTHWAYWKHMELMPARYGYNALEGSEYECPDISTIEF